MDPLSQQNQYVTKLTLKGGHQTIQGHISLHRNVINAALLGAVRGTVEAFTNTANVHSLDSFCSPLFS